MAKRIRTRTDLTLNTTEGSVCRHNQAFVAQFEMTVPATAKRLQKNSRSDKGLPQALKREVIFNDLTARLNRALPDQREPGVFPQPVEP